MENINNTEQKAAEKVKMSSNLQQSQAAADYECGYASQRLRSASVITSNLSEKRLESQAICRSRSVNHKQRHIACELTVE